MKEKLVPGLKLRLLVEQDGSRPSGFPPDCDAWTHYISDWEPSTRRLTVASGYTVGRFWPAVWDVERDVYIKRGPGEQWEKGKVVGVFP